MVVSFSDGDAGFCSGFEVVEKWERRRPEKVEKVLSSKYIYDFINKVVV